MSKRGKASQRKRANEMLLASELWLQLLQGLREGVTVHRFVLEPLTAEHVAAGEVDLEFEIVLTGFGDLRLTRGGLCYRKVSP